MIKRLWFGGLSRARLYRRLILREWLLSQTFPDVSARVPVCVRLLAAGEVDAYRAFRPDQSSAEVRCRIEEGQHCFAVWHDRRIIHAAWAATGRVRIEYLSSEVALAPDEVCVYDAFTAPASRGLGVSPVRAIEMRRHFRDRGYRRLLSAVLPENRSGLREGEKFGRYRHIAVIGYIGLGPWRHVFRRMERGASPPGRTGRAPWSCPGCRAQPMIRTADVLSTWWQAGRHARASRDEIVAYQNAQLRRLVRHAYSNVPYYRTLFDRHGVAAHQVRAVADLALIPVTSRRDLQRAPAVEVVATRLHALAMPFIRYRLGDLVTQGVTPCPCGAPFSTIVTVQGRMLDYYDDIDWDRRRAMDLTARQRSAPKT